MNKENKGLDPLVVEDYKKKIQENSHNYLSVESEDNSDEYQNFYFVGEYNGKEVIYDTVIYTLALHYHSELYTMAEEKASGLYPTKKGKEEEDEEYGQLLAEIMMDLEDEDEVKVSEYMEIDPDADFGIGLDVSLHVDQVTPEVISRFVQEFTEGKVNLDKTLYSFHTEEED